MRILLKISGERLRFKNNIYDECSIKFLCKEIIKIYNLGVEICILVGGGNILRGKENKLSFLNKSYADNVGILATIMNSIVVSRALEMHDIRTKVFSSIPLECFCSTYNNLDVNTAIQRKKIVIFGGGIGISHFSTDTAAVQRGIDMNCDKVIKCTNVEGIYDKDPNKNISAKKIKSITYEDFLSKNLKIMDLTAISLAKEHNMEIQVVSIENISSSIQGTYKSGTIKNDFKI